MNGATQYRQILQDGATVAVIGGGPAGAFSAIHLLSQARQHGRQIRVLVFERNCQPSDEHPQQLWGAYAGCPQCAGGISPRLYAVLQGLGIELQPAVIQASIGSITVQGNWKSIVLPVPRDRPMLSVYRGSLPFGQHHQHCFDAMMLGIACDAGAELIGSAVHSYDAAGKMELGYLLRGQQTQLTADFAIFAGGVNETPNKSSAEPNLIDIFQQLQPRYTPPRLRKALIFELEELGGTDKARPGELHFIESSAPHLQLEMCSILSKRGYITVSLVGKSVDQSSSNQQNMRVIKDFLALPQIGRAMPPHMQPAIRCICNPYMVVGTASRPFGSRIAAVGDMATSRHYKDGILAAHNMAESLARTLVEEGIDERSLATGYGPTIADFKRDNRYATLIFFLYRRFFTNPFLSRVIYQAFASEKKAKPEKLRTFKRVFWAISSGDATYKEIAWSMFRPATVWLVLWGGVFTTLRNGAGEWFFGLDWRGIGRVPTAVSRREFKAKRVDLLNDRMRSGLLGRLPEFECMYTVCIHAAAEKVLALLAQFGEEGRPYLNPRWVRIRRTAGEPLAVGSVISYTIFGGFISFSIELQPDTGDDMLIYKVRDGFVGGGEFVFEVKPLPGGYCDLTIYLAFDYARGSSPWGRVYWRLFKLLFPEFIHEVLWNHALCELKHVAEARDPVSWQV